MSDVGVDIEAVAADIPDFPDLLAVGDQNDVLLANANADNGLKHGLSQRELDYLREAGIAVHMLNHMDRARVVASLMADNSFAEDLGIGGNAAAFIYKAGGLRDLLRKTTDEKVLEDTLAREGNTFLTAAPGEYAANNPIPENSMVHVVASLKVNMNFEVEDAHGINLRPEGHGSHAEREEERRREEAALLYTY